MRRFSERELSHALSLFLDGLLDKAGREELEEYLAVHPEAKRELEELRSLRTMLSAKRKLPPHVGFWPRLSAAIEDRSKEDENLLPFPNKFLLAITAFAAVVLVIAGLMVFQNRTRIGQYLSERSRAVQSVYEEGLLKGSILPLFSDIDKNQVLQFALFGTLPLDAKAETALRVDEQAEKGYRIEVGKTSGPKTKQVTVQDFLSEIHSTPEQAGLIDSLLEVAQKRIESSVLVSENDALAIDPDLPSFNRLMVSSIAACLEPPQRARFKRFLEAGDAPYAIGSHEGPAATPDEVLMRFHKPHRVERFVVVTPDTAIVTNNKINLDSLQRYVEREVEQSGRARVKAETFIRRFAEREFVRAPRLGVGPKPIEFHGDSDFFSIEFGRELGIPDIGPFSINIRPRPRVAVRPGTPLPGSGFDLKFFSHPRNPEEIDSFMMRFFGPGGEKNFEEMDSMVRHFSPEFGRSGKKHPKLDSLIRSMELKWKKQESLQHQPAPKAPSKKKHESPVET